MWTIEFRDGTIKWVDSISIENGRCIFSYTRKKDGRVENYNVPLDTVSLKETVGETVEEHFAKKNVEQ